jgi:hypothetical protein
MTYAARLRRVLAAAFCLCGILLAVGCSGKGVVSGKVQYKGKPVLGGSVSLIPATGGAMSSPIEEDGSYTIRDVPPGTAKITVETESFRPPVPPRGVPGVSSEYMKKSLEQMNPGMNDPQRAKRYVQIPAEYSDPDKSNLTCTVKGGKQEHNIDLK